MSSHSAVPKALSIFSLALLVFSLVFVSDAFARSRGVTNVNAGIACNACHSGGVAPTVEITGPAQVNPGSTTDFFLTVSGGQQFEFGFNAAVTGGTFVPVGFGVGLTNGQLHQVQPLATNAAGVGTVVLRWVAPNVDGTYTINVGALSSNGSATYFGDAGATATFTITVGAGGTPPPAPTPTGEQLYANNCAVCHGALASSTKLGRTAAQIQNAINAGIGGMGALSGLTPTEVGLIAEALGGGGGTPTPLPPVADPGGPYAEMTGTAIIFDGSASTDPDGTVMSYDWDFGDGTTGTGVNPSHAYAAAGLYTVSLTVMDNDGQTDTATTTANIADAAPPPVVLDGAQLYADNCSGCHGNLAASSKQGRTAQQIQDAIAANIGGMGFLSVLTPEEIQAISDALGGGGTPTPQPPVANSGGPYTGSTGTAVAFNGSGSNDPDGTIVAYDWNFGDGGTGTGPQVNHIYAAPGLYTVTLVVTDNDGQTGTASTTANIADGTPPPPVIDGAQLYTSNCSACHGPLATSAKLNRTAAQIQGAIDANVGGMGGLSGLSAAEVSAIADALSTGGTPPPAPTDGEGLYNGFCAACHGPNGEGGAEEAVRGESANSIQQAINSEPDMAYLSSLSSQEIQLIADFLSGNGGGGGTPEVTGVELYATYCAACHGADGKGGIEEGVLRESARSIQEAIAEEPDMRFLSSLTGDQIQKIANALNTSEGVPPPPAGGTPQTGAELYAASCMGCHGDAATRFAGGRSLAQIKAAIQSIGAMNGISLSDANLQLIADYTGGGGGGGGTPTPTPTPNTGADLYASSCQGCHGDPAVRFAGGRTLQQIQSAITGVPAMNGIALPSGDLQLIADFLAGMGGGNPNPNPTPTPTPTPGTGADLYAANCQGCHGDSAARFPGGRTAAQINSAIASVSAMSGISLSAADIQAISDFMVGNSGPAPTTGVGLYDAYCASCHGAGGRGGTEEAVRGASAREIRSAISGERDMNFLSGLLDSSQIQLISDYLNGNNSTTDGSHTYTRYCESCHGRRGSEDGRRVRSSSYTSINNAIASEPSMQFLGDVLTASTVSNISQALGNSGGDGGDDGAGAGGGGGGGCTLVEGNSFDPLWLLLLLGSIYQLYAQRNRREKKLKIDEHTKR